MRAYSTRQPSAGFRPKNPSGSRPTHLTKSQHRCDWEMIRRVTPALMLVDDPAGDRLQFRRVEDPIDPLSRTLSGEAVEGALLFAHLWVRNSKAVEEANRLRFFVDQRAVGLFLLARVEVADEHDRGAVTPLADSRPQELGRFGARALAHMVEVRVDEQQRPAAAAFLEPHPRRHAGQLRVPAARPGLIRRLAQPHVAVTEHL